MYLTSGQKYLTHYTMMHIDKYITPCWPICRRISALSSRR